MPRSLLLVLITAAACGAWMLSADAQAPAHLQKEVIEETVPRYDSSNAHLLLEEARRELQHNPHAAFWHNQSAVAYMQLGDLDAAERELEQAIRNEPDAPINYVFLAVLWQKRGDLEKEMEWLRRALELDGKNPSVHLQLGDALLRSRKWDEALRHYRQARAHAHQQEKFASGWVYYDPKGAAYSTWAPVKQAAEERIRLAEQRNPLPSEPAPPPPPAEAAEAPPDDDLSPHRILERAREELRYNPHASHWHERAATAYLLRSDYSAALAEAEEAIRQDPRLPYAYALAADLHTRRGEHSAAVERLREAVRRDPEDPLHRLHLGEALARVGDTAAALAEFEACLKLLEAGQEPRLSLETASQVRAEAEAHIRALRTPTAEPPKR